MVSDDECRTHNFTTFPVVPVGHIERILHEFDEWGSLLAEPLRKAILGGAHQVLVQTPRISTLIVFATVTAPALTYSGWPGRNRYGVRPLSDMGLVPTFHVIELMPSDSTMLCTVASFEVISTP